MIEVEIITNYGVKGVLGFLLGALAAFLVNISMQAMRIIVIAQAAFLGFLAVAGIIDINFGRLIDIIAGIVAWLVDAASSIFSSILELGSFGTGVAAGYIGTTVLISMLTDE